MLLLAAATARKAAAAAIQPAITARTVSRVISA